MSQLCLPLGVDQADVVKLEALVQNSTTLHNGDPIFRQGDPFNKIYAVKSGTFKSTRVDEFGHEQILAFHLPGELVGLDGIYPEAYSCTTVALDTAVMCELDYDKLSALCTSIPTLQRQLLRLLSRDIYDSHISLADTAEQTAEQKLASFLHNLSTRFEIRGYSPSQFNLAMSRQDIANHIGLAPETVSRLLKKLKQEDVLEINNRSITILDHNRLSEVISCGHS